MELNVGVFFDGTGNNRTESDDIMSNVGKLSHLYVNHDGKFIPGNDKRFAMLYVRGVGTKSDGEHDPIDNDFGEWEVGGAAFGHGGKERIAFMLERLDELIDQAQFPVIIDVFGFSRGAALARSFVNIIVERSFSEQYQMLHMCSNITVRFVGIYDTVGSFGTPGDDDDPYNFHLGKTKANYIYHITAQDELRKNFDLQSLKRTTAEMLSFPTEVRKNWMVEEAMPGVHSDIGGGYSSSEEQGNNNNELAKIYLRKMHKTACRQNVPLQPLSQLDAVEGRNIQWKVSQKLADEFSALMGSYFNDARLLRLHQPLKDSQRYLEVVKKKLSRHRNRSHYKDTRLVYQQKKIERLESRIKCLEDLIVNDCFAGDSDEANVFFSRYTAFRKNYVHRSHNPFNSTIGMGAQLKKRNKKSAVEMMVNDVKPANELVEIYKRDVFLNNKKQLTQYIEDTDSLSCYIQFVSKNDPSNTFSEGVTIEAWDDDLGKDDGMGLGVTDRNGCVNILCFDIDSDRDLYFAFDGEGKKFVSGGQLLPDDWESKDHNCRKDSVNAGFKKGMWKNFEEDQLGDKNNPIIIYV
jgi:hypothetical protein